MLKILKNFIFMVQKIPQNIYDYSTENLLNWLLLNK